MDPITFAVALGAAAPAGEADPGGHLFEGSTSADKTFTWTCPAGVTSVCVVCIGSGKPNGGAGGGLSYKNDIAVTPGTGYTVFIGWNSSNKRTYFISNTGLRTDGRAGGTSSYGADGGGYGGFGNVSGAGAGGYSGNGGQAYGETNQSGAAGSGGGGGAGGGVYNYPSNWAGGGGGGVGVYGEGSSGAGGSGVAGGGGGSGGGAGGSCPGTSGPGGDGGNYGGAAGQGQNGAGTPGPGAVRIIWGEGRSFPSTNVGQNYAGFTESFTS